MAKTWIRVDIPCGPETADEVGAELAQELGTTVEFTPDGIRIYFDSTVFGRKRKELEKILESTGAAVPGREYHLSFTVSELADEDWSETWKAHFKPLRVGRTFLVTPTWEDVRPGAGDLVIRIDPGRAFGTGHHETTRLCLEWLESRAESAPFRSRPRPWSLLDVGTGSGILAMGAALLGFEQIVAIDNDPEAVEVAAFNVELNGLAGKIKLFTASPGTDLGVFDVVISNIQSLPLIRMSRTLVSLVREGGRLVLSGILAEQAEEVRSEYEKRGALLSGTLDAGEWVLLDFEIPKRISNG